MDISAIRTAGLGDTTYIMTHGSTTVVVDPQRDIERFVDALDGRTVDLVLETHLHNDYVSGGTALAAATDAQLVVPAGAAPAYRHRPAFHMEDIETDGLVIRPIHTPGHTPEHTSYLVLVDGAPTAVFSGGSLLVGSAGRPDLLGEARADSLARLQYISVNRLGALPGDVGLFPTHGEGSFCTASGAGRSSSTIADEVASNPVLQHDDVESFVEAQLSGLQPYPTYYAHMGPANTFGYPEPDTGAPAHLDVEAIATSTARVVDIRPRADFAAGHIPGALGLEMGDQVGVWAGWLLPFDAPVVIVATPDQDIDEAVRQFRRIGMDRIEGVFTAMDDWTAAGHGTSSYRSVTPEEFAAAVRAGEATQLLDVRGPAEFEGGSVDGARWQYLPDIPADPGAGFDAASPVWVGCGSGYRATAAAGLLEAAGFEPIVLASGGMPNVADLLTG